jgi:hypothetical protein
MRRWSEILVAGAIGIVIGAASMWALLRPPSMSPDEAAFYDHCLAASGSTVSCDAGLRIMRRESARPKPTTLSTVDEAFGPPRKSAPLPTVEEFFGPPPK